MRYERFNQYTSKWTVVKTSLTKEQADWCRNFQSPGAYAITYNFAEVRFQLLEDAVAFKLTHQLVE